MRVQKKVWGVGLMRDGKAQEKLGLPTVSTSLSLALCTKDVATFKETRWIGGSLEGYFDRDDSRVKQEPRLYLKLLFQGIHATTAKQSPQPSA